MAWPRFFSFRAENAQAFRIALSIEKDPFAHKTLELRSLEQKNYPDNAVHERIKKARGNAEKLVLIGGPPCQAYSTVGRSRNKGKKRRVYLPVKVRHKSDSLR